MSKRITQKHILDLMATEARAARTPAKKAEGLFALFHRYSSDADKMPLAEEIIQLVDEDPSADTANIKTSIRRYLAGAELRKVDQVPEDERDVQIQRAIDAIQAHPEGSERITLLSELSRKVED
jgi:hypothetical protein